MGTKINTILQNYATPPHPTAYGGINTVSQHYNLQPNKVAKILTILMHTVYTENIKNRRYAILFI